MRHTHALKHHPILHTSLHTSLDKARELERTGDIADANNVYKKLITSTDDDIVLERSIREYGRNLAKGDALAALQKKIELASNPRIRAVARAGAVEELARAYLYDTGVDSETLTKEIFAVSPFTELRARAREDTPDYVVLLEYSNVLSPRPVATAILAEYYAKEMYKGNTRVQKDLEAMLTALDTLIPEIPERSPTITVTLTYQASALLYASAAGINYDGKYADQIFKNAITQSQELTDFIFNSLISTTNNNFSSEELTSSLNKADFSPAAQYRVIFTTLNEIPALNQAEGIIDTYRQNPPEHSESPTALTTQIKQLAIKYPSAVTLLEN